MDSVLVISLATICSGIAMLIIRTCYKSKCSHISLCSGLVDIERNIQAEAKEDAEASKSEKKNDSAV
jgi:hypothetical protein